LNSACVNHILHGQAEMAGRLDEVHAAIVQRDFVAWAVRYHQRENYYRQTPSRQDWIGVVASYQSVPQQGIRAGEVITVYRFKQPDPQEVPCHYEHS
jgi:hypothetical protein